MQEKPRTIELLNTLGHRRQCCGSSMVCPGDHAFTALHHQMVVLFGEVKDSLRGVTSVKEVCP